MKEGGKEWHYEGIKEEEDGINEEENEEGEASGWSWSRRSRMMARYNPNGKLKDPDVISAHCPFVCCGHSRRGGA